MADDAYDYVVESFYTEYKLDVDTLNDIIKEYRITTSESERFKLLMQFKRLYPEFKGDTLSGNINIPPTVKKQVYFVQPPRNKETGRALVYYSLKSRMLTTLRDHRGEVKKLMKAAKKAGDNVLASRYNAMQNAIKVIMNTEYGASGNKLFAHYDPDIAGAVTYLSRTLIHFLTRTLEESTTMYVDERFYNENKQLIDKLQSIQCIQSVDKPILTNEAIFKNRVRVIRRVFDDEYNVLTNDLWCIHIEKSQVIYQDTDSNYYINPYIQKYYNRKDMTPTDIKECMVSMMAHNTLINNFAIATINRTPIGLGFEGAFIVCRYFYRKKKYYGKKYEEDMLATIPEGEQWTPTRSCEPLPNGDYIYLDNKLLLGNANIVAHGKSRLETSEATPKVVNFLDYINGQGIKCTGVNLARRDQYKFINYYHMVVIKDDMKLIARDKDNKWYKTTPASMKDSVRKITDRFREVAQQYELIARGEDDTFPKDNFKLIDFSRPLPYRKAKQGRAKSIVERMVESETDLKDFIPEDGERINVVVILDEETRQLRLTGVAGMGNVAGRSRTVEELLASTRKDNPGDSEELINAKACAQLDFKYYMKSLADAMALYVVDEYYPDYIRRINEGYYETEAEIEKVVDMLQKKIGAIILQEYYPSKTSVKSTLSKCDRDGIADVKREFKTYAKGVSYDNSTYKYTKKLIDNARTLSDEDIVSRKNEIISKLEKRKEKLTEEHNSAKYVYSMLSTNKLDSPDFDVIDYQIKHKLGDDPKVEYEDFIRDRAKNIEYYTQALAEWGL